MRPLKVWQFWIIAIVAWFSLAWCIHQVWVVQLAPFLRANGVKGL